MSRVRMIAWLALLLAVPGATARPSADSEPTVERQIAYAGDERTLDLYLPRIGKQRPPLLVFVQSRFWAASGSSAREIEGAVARPLQGQGVAVAVVGQRGVPEHPHPAQVEGLAAALAFLVREADRFGFDPARIFLLGHSAGGHTVALLALDPAYLAAVGLEPSVLAGVAAVSGVYDLDPPDGRASPEELALYERAFGGGSARRDASPIRHVRGDAPRFVVLVAQADIPGFVEGAADFVRTLRASGHPDAETYRILGRDHVSILDLRDPEAGAAVYLLELLGIRPLPPEMAELDRASRYWREPGLSTEPFWDHGVKVRSHAADERFLQEARAVFMGLTFKRKEWKVERFHAIDLFDWLEARAAEVGSGRWLVLTNAQNEKTYLDLEAIRKLEPVIVIGADDERNLFRIVDIHRAKRANTWQEELPRPPWSARPLGAFLYFLKEPEEPVMPLALTYYSLHPQSFARTDVDPLAGLADIGPELLRTVTLDQGCVSCHTLRGVGARAGHLRATDGQLQGGIALPLEEYPPEVWRRFVYDQEAVAAEIGASPNPVPEPQATRLYQLVESERGGAAGGGS